MVYTVVSIQWYYWLIYRVVLFVAGSSKLKGFFYDTKDVFVFASSFISTWIQFFNDKSNKKKPAQVRYSAAHNTTIDHEFHNGYTSNSM
jgi:hypothetical protein